MSEDIRVVLPNLDVTNQVQATGIALINVFAQDLFDFIDIEILPINKMLVNGKIWSGCEKNYSLKNELA